MVMYTDNCGSAVVWRRMPSDDSDLPPTSVGVHVVQTTFTLQVVDLYYRSHQQSNAVQGTRPVLHHAVFAAMLHAPLWSGELASASVMAKRLSSHRSPKGCSDMWRHSLSAYGSLTLSCSALISATVPTDCDP